VSAIPLRRIEGKYEILEKLGEGGMGAVYKVRHRLLDDVRVIKMMRPQLVADEEFKVRFQREAKLAIRLRHPNIAHLIDFTIDEEDGTAFIVMELIDGMTLEEMLRNAGPPPLGLALEIAQQSLRALTCLHEKGFVHRDISPDNLMLTEDVDGRPLIKLIDLGIAKVLGAGAEASHLTGTGIFLGKVRYSPPEQFGTEGAASVDARGDLYSFGIVFYELLTGKYPITGRDHSSMIAGHLFRPPLDFAESDPAGHVPSELRKLVLKTLAKDPAQRFASARELGGALAALRFPGDVADGDLKQALTRLPTGTVRISTPPGSTQDRLDFQFGLGTTPSRRNPAGKTQTASSSRRGVEEAVATIERHIQRGDLLTAETEIQWAIDTFGEQPELGELRGRIQQRRSRELELRVQTLLKEAEGLFAGQDFEAALERLQKGKALAPGNVGIAALLAKVESAAREQRRARDIAGVREEIEAALARSDFRGAEKRLYEAEASYGEQEAFPALHQRLGELRRQSLEARRRAERLAAAVREIDVKLVRGELDEAERLLDQAVSTFGEEQALAELRGRLEDARSAARQAESAALMRTAMQRRDEADLDGALEEARRALQIDPDHGTARSLVEEISAALARRAEEVRRTAREAEIAALLQTARSRREADDLEGALETAGRIFALEAENAAARTLVKEIEAEKRRREKEARKAEKLAKAVAVIEGRLGEGDLAAAGSLLDAAISSHGEVEVLQNLRTRLDDLRQAAREAEIAAEIAALVESARGRREADDLEGALEIARRVFALDAENAAARALVAEIAAEQRLQEEEARRAERLAASVATIEDLLEDGNLAKAGALLAAAISSHGETEALGDLRDRLEKLEAEKRRREEEARRAEQLAAEEARRAQQLAAAVASIDACLDLEDPEGAARLLPGIVAVFGDTVLLRERWERIESLRRRKLEKRVADLVAQARKLVSRNEFEAALGGLREAGRLLPDHPEVQALTGEIEAELRRRDEAGRRERELAVALSAIDACLEQGDLAGAARLLPGAVGTFGGAPALRERWERLDALQRKARVETLRGEAEALVQAGHLDRATRKLRQALELDPGNLALASLLEGLARR
jgi:serine/threonine protein kinase/antitoxin component HigA of HigAB toxin-antitoxin module